MTAAERHEAAARSVGPSSPSTTRPASTTSPAALRRRRRRARLDRRSTAKTIAALGVPVTQVEELTGFPECLDGRVKTLHPKVHAGILADTRNPTTCEQLADLGVEPFDLVVVNLYPFRETVASGASPTSASSRSTSAARRWCAPRPRTTRASPSSRARRHTPTSSRPSARRLHAGRAPAAGGRGVRAHGDYDIAVASWMGNVARRHDRRHRLPGLDGRDVRPRGGAALRREPAPERGALPALAAGRRSAEQLHGKEMSYNNYVDTDAAVRAAHDHGTSRRSRSSSTPIPRLINSLATTCLIDALAKGVHEIDPIMVDQQATEIGLPLGSVTKLGEHRGRHGRSAQAR